MSSESSDSSSNIDKPKKRGRKTIPQDQKRRIYWVCCPSCKHQFEFYHGRPELKPDPVTTKEMSATEKNKIYHQRYLEKQKKLKNLENKIEIGKCLLDD